MLNLFIDTNVYLTFLHFASDDLSELEKLLAAINNKEVRLYTTDHLHDEFKRNREKRIADSLKPLREAKLPKRFPQIARNYDEFSDLQDASKEFEKHLSSILEQVREDAENESLAADKIIADLLSVSDRIEVTEEIEERARRRSDLGNPPGKKGSIGDAINWESLLEELPDHRRLYLVTDDNDFVSALDKERPSQFLAEEWNEAKHSNLLLYRRLSAFFRDKFPEIKLPSEFDKEFAIRRLTKSGNFNATHNALAVLRKYSDFSAQQARDLLSAAISNNQIYWIATDADVNSFFSTLVTEHFDAFDDDDIAEYSELFGEPDEEDDDADYYDDAAYHEDDDQS